MAVVKLPDGSKREVADGSSVMQVAESIGRGLAKAAVAAKVDGKVVDLSSKLEAGEHELSILTDENPEALLVLRHSTAHVMAEAIQKLWPQAHAGVWAGAGDWVLLRHFAGCADFHRGFSRRSKRRWRRSSRRIGRSLDTNWPLDDGHGAAQEGGQQVQDRQRQARDRRAARNR